MIVAWTEQRTSLLQREELLERVVRAKAGLADRIGLVAEGFVEALSQLFPDDCFRRRRPECIAIRSGIVPDQRRPFRKWSASGESEETEGEDRVRVACADTGIGIAPEDLVRLARPFEQVEGQHSKTTQGTGLGLAMTKSLIEMHGGQLSMESQPGVGTVVSFDLPVKRPDQTVQPIRAAFAA